MFPYSHFMLAPSYSSTKKVEPSGALIIPLWLKLSFVLSTPALRPLQTIWLILTSAIAARLSVSQFSLTLRRWQLMMPFSWKCQPPRPDSKQPTMPRALLLEVPTALELPRWAFPSVEAVGKGLWQLTFLLAPGSISTPSKPEPQLPGAVSSCTSKSRESWSLSRVSPSPQTQAWAGRVSQGKATSDRSPS
jgi:hypothetical protein